MKNASSVFFLLYCFVSISQNKKTITFTTKAGLNFTSIKEQRFSSIVHKGFIPTYTFGLTSKKNNTKERLTIDFSYTSNFTKEHSLTYEIVAPNVTYTYLKKINNQLNIGGFFQSFTFLNFPKSELTNFVNNSISYTISQNIGISFDYLKKINEKINFESNINLGLVSYTIRPAYTHPYPTEFLKPDVFSPDRDGMTLPLLKSGKLLTIDKLQNIHFLNSLNYSFKNWVISTSIGLNYFNIVDEKAFQLFQVYFGFGVHYKVN